MRIIKIFFYLFMMLSLGMHAQETDFSKEVSIYLESNGSMKQYEYAYDQLLILLANQYPPTDDSEEGWKFIKAHKKDALSEMMQELIPIYQENFEAEEIKSMTAFYQSETGIQLMNDRTRMTAEQKDVFNDFYSSELGKKIIEKQPILTQAISVVSESWSRDLYEISVSLLK